MAETWHLPPWEAEEAPALWVDRWLAWREARNKAEKAQSKHPHG